MKPDFMQYPQLLACFVCFGSTCFTEHFLPNTCNLWSYLKGTDHISRLYKTSSRLIVSHFLITLYHS